MSAEKALAIVLKVVEFSETSSVVTLFSREHGKLHALAKGARRPKGPFESALDLLAQCRIVFLRKSSGALDLLTEAKLEKRFRPAGGDLASLHAGYYAVELLSELTDDHDPHPELFDQVQFTLAVLSGIGASAPLVVRLELAALRLLGHLPALDVCAECGEPVPIAARVPFGQLAGGVLCGRCRQGKRQVVAVSGPVIAALRALAETDKTWQTVALDRRTYGELRAVLNHYLASLTGRAWKMHRYLASLAGNT